MPIIVAPGAPYVAPTTATSSDGALTARTDAYGGVVLRADFRTWTKPDKVRFLRDGIPVRGSDPVWSPGGVAIGYDQEAPLGVPSTWTVQRMFIQSNGTYAGIAPQSPVTLTVPDLDTDRDFWVKSIINPNLSLRLGSNIPDPEFTLTGRDSLTELPGNELPGGSWDAPLRQPVTYTFKTDTHIERDAVLTVLRSGPVLIQSLRLYGIADGYFVFATASESYLIAAYDPQRLITIQFKPISRPPTAESALYVQGHSYDAVKQSFASYTALAAAVPTLEALVRP